MSAKKYDLHNAEHMIDLARDIQSFVYWRGSFYLGETVYSWKNFWDIVVGEIDEHQAIGVEIIDGNEVRFIYQ